MAFCLLVAIMILDLPPLMQYIYESVSVYVNYLEKKLMEQKMLYGSLNV
jgi:hypothetical protein